MHFGGCLSAAPPPARHSIRTVFPSLPQRYIESRFSLYEPSGAVRWLAIGGAALLFLLLTYAPLHAQRFDHYWYFGNGAGISFWGASPVSIAGGQTMTSEGIAVVSDPVTHNRIFYTDGLNVWDSTHQLIPIPGGLDGGRSSTQAALIVPVPGYSRRYTIFTTAQAEGGDHISVGLRYTTLDFNDPSVIIELNVPLMAPSTEKVTAVRSCNGEDYWIVAHSWENDEFHSWLLTSGGLNTTPVISKVGPVQNSRGSPAGYLEASSDGRLLAMAVFSNYAGVFSFNNATGRVSAERPLLTPHDSLAAYGICFSPDMSKVYVSTQDLSVQGKGLLLQFDLSAGNPAATRDTLFIAGSFGAIEPGIDGRLYVARYGSTYLGVVQNPNVLGSGCGFRYDGIALTTGTSTFGLPNVIVAVGGGAPNIVGNLDLGPDTLHCPGIPIQLHASGADRYVWTPAYGLSCADCPDPFVSPDTQTTYVVTGYSGAGCIRTDTITVGVDSNRLPVHAISSSQQDQCAGAEAVLVADVPPDAHVRWRAAESLVCDTCRTISVRPTETSVYILDAWTDEGCRGRDSIAVFVNAKALLPITVGGAASLCPGDTVPIHVDLPSNDNVRVRWTPSTGLACDTCAVTAAFPDTTTTYVAELFSISECYARDSVTIRVVDPVMVSTSLGPEISLRPGTPTVIPLTISGLPVGVSVDNVDLSLKYNPRILRLKAVRTLAQTAGWTPSNEASDQHTGTYSAHFASTGGTINSNGVVFELEFGSYYGDTVLVGRVDLEALELRGTGCVKTETSSVGVRLDSICWGMMRAIESLPFGSDKLTALFPSPAGDAVRVKMNAAETRQITLEAVDGAGAWHQLGGGEVVAGEHELEVSLVGLPSGLYHLVVRTGAQIIGSLPLLVVH